MITIEEIPAERINEFWTIHIKYLVEDLSIDEEDQAYFSGEAYRGHIHKLMLRVLAGNVRARRSYEKAGFVQEAYLRDEVYLDGGFQDVILMAAWNPAEQETQEAL